MSENNEIKEPLNKNYKVPKLRFPEFYTIYNSQTISSIFKLTGGGTPSTKEEKYWLGTMPWISSSDLIEFDINKISETRFISNEAIENSATKIVPAFSILVVTRVGLGKVAVNEHPICTSQDFTNLYSNNINPYYFAYLIQKHLSKKVPQGSTIKGISSKELAKMNLTYPTKNEQDKIYSFLHILDKKIDVINSKIAILKKYKEGFTKRLTKTLNTDEIALSNICSITTGKMDANAMNPHGKYKFFTCSREDYFIDIYAFDCEALLVSGNGEVGLTKYYNGKFNAYQRTYVLYNLKKNAKFIKLFIDLQINTIIRKETNKGTMPYIRLTTFNKIMIPNIDSSLEYLISIAIDKIDKKIELLQNHARVLNNIKNNLLGSLFI